MTKLLGGLQVVALLAQGTPDLIGVIPHKWHPLFHFSLSALQALGWYAQRGYDPSGVRTPGESR